ncbi:ERAD-associated protein [Tulasnella sp. 418]|nr:ERAD-associated protein [Tulasnella sp. 418]
MRRRDRNRGKSLVLSLCFLWASSALLVTQASTDSANDAPLKDSVTNGQKVLKNADDPLDSEASRFYMQALRGIEYLCTLPPSHASPHPSAYKPGYLNSLTNERSTAGPLSSVLRIASKLPILSWLPNLLTGTLSGGAAPSGRRKEELRRRAFKTIELLERASELGHEDAMYILADVSLFPPSPLIPVDPAKSFKYFSKHADITGNATSQAAVAFFYATGYANVVDVDQSQALLHYTFGALSGSQTSQMALGYRHWAGIGVNEDCMTALGWYEKAAETSMDYFLSGPPGGRTLPLTNTRLSDLYGGVYGPGASVASTGRNADRAAVKAGFARAAGETWEDVMEFYQYHADRGQVDFAYRLGKIYYHGSVYAVPGGAASGAEGVGAIKRDFYKARSYFFDITRKVWPRHNIKSPLAFQVEKVDHDTLATAALAAGYLGRMYLRGEGVKQDAKIAKMWFQRGVAYKDKESAMGLGLIWRDGLVDGQIDLKKALQFFLSAAGRDLAEAEVQLGKHYYELGDYSTASTYFESATRHGSPYEAYYYLAEMHSNHAHDPKTPETIRYGYCSTALSYYKLVAERGSWLENFMGDAEQLWDYNELRSNKGRKTDPLVRDLEKEGAKLRWWIAAEAGNEIAQNNLAYLLDQDKSALRYTRFASRPSNETARLALTQWIRSANQRNVDALVKVGDYYYHGLGVANESQEVRWAKAAGYYHSAHESQVSALAMWNLGWMYENGVGVEQDFHLAKRYYDNALETNSDAKLPVLLSLIKLHLRSYWYTLTGGTQKGLTLWDSSEDSEDHWYLGKAWKKSWGGKKREIDGRDGDVDLDSTYLDEDDSVQWAREKRREELERERAEHDAEGGFGPEDYFDAAIGGPGRRQPLDDRDELLDDMILVAVLCVIVGMLVYARTRLVARREEEGRARERAIQLEREREAAVAALRQ